MSGPAPLSPLDGPRPRDERAELKRMCHELEGLFLRQLLETTRTTAREEGLFDSAPGAEIFTSLMDDRLASEAAQRMDRGIGEALYRQLSRRLDEQEGTCPHAQP
jgi:Rod binding domain-containing protein